MAQIGTIQAIGNANNANVEVELNNLAIRNVIRPYDFTYLGSYSQGSTIPVATGSIAQTGSTGAGIAGIFNASANTALLLRKAFCSAIITTAGTTSAASVNLTRFNTPGQGNISSVSNAVEIIPGSNKLRSGAPSHSAVIYKNNVASLTIPLLSGGVATYDTNEETSISFIVGGTGTGIVNANLRDWTNSMPLVLQANEGVEIIVIATAMGTGTLGNLSYTFVWDEVALQW